MLVKKAIQIHLVFDLVLCVEYLFDQGELGEGAIASARTAFDGAAVQLLTPLHILPHCRVDETILERRGREEGRGEEIREEGRGEKEKR